MFSCYRMCSLAIECVLLGLRDDVAAPLLVWDTLLDGLISDISHLRKLRYA